MIQDEAHCASDIVTNSHLFYSKLIDLPIPKIWLLKIWPWKSKVMGEVKVSSHNLSPTWSRVGFLPEETYFFRDTRKKVEETYFFQFCSDKTGRNWTKLTVRNPLLLCPLVLAQDGGTRSRQKCLHRDFSATVLNFTTEMHQSVGNGMREFCDISKLTITTVDANDLTSRESQC